MNESPMSFTQIERPKTYTAIVDKIVEQIEIGHLEPGTPLPAERPLADQLGVSRTTLREAIRVLEHAGILEVRVGSGTYVADASRAPSILINARAQIVGDHSPADLLVARRTLEPACARLAAGKQSPELVAGVREALDVQKEAFSTGVNPAESDLLFHVSIGKATANPVLVRLQEQLLSLTLEDTWTKFMSRTDRWGGQIIDEHEAILTAIEAGNGEAAMEAMTVHLNSVDARYLRSGH